MKKLGQMAFPVLILAPAVLLWGCQNDHGHRNDGSRLGSMLVGAEDGGNTSGGDQQMPDSCSADSMDHGMGEMDGDSCGMGDMHGGGGMGGMHGGSGGMGHMGDMHGGSGGMGDMHGESGCMGDSVQTPEGDDHSGHH